MRVMLAVHLLPFIPHRSTDGDTIGGRDFNLCYRGEMERESDSRGQDRVSAGRIPTSKENPWQNYYGCNQWI